MKPKVSVRIVTYNHQRFIAQALDSVLAQKVNFPFEIVIGEDCSTDNTRRIVRDYQNRHPDIICPIFNERNMGCRFTTRAAREACRGEYMAFLDGDDYWTSTDKLQKQADLLDSQPEVSICFHNANIIHEDGRQLRLYNLKPLKTVLGIEDTLDYNVMPSCSMIFRRDLLKGIPEVFAAVPFGDWPIQLCCLKQGKAAYINEVMGAYRSHSGGVWTRGGDESPQMRIRRIQGLVLFYQAADIYLDFKYKDKITKLLNEMKTELRELKMELIKKPIRESLPSLLKVYRSLKGNV